MQIKRALLSTVLVTGTFAASWEDWRDIANGQPPAKPVVTSAQRPTLTSASTPKPTKSDIDISQACAKVASLAASATNAAPDVQATVPAQLAYQCLNSVPFNQTAAQMYIESLESYFDWQAGLDWVARPPPQYAQKIQRPYDFWAAWTSIKSKVGSKAYASEYEFGRDVYLSVQLTHDTHFILAPDIIGLFSFARNLPLVSVSLDGRSDPKPYLYADILLSSNGTSTFTPSAITEVNGQNVMDYLLNWSQHARYADPDTLYNFLFFTTVGYAVEPGPFSAGCFSGGGNCRLFYPGPSTTLTFANGSSLTQENFAFVNQPFDGVASGADLYSKFLVPPPDAYLNVFDYADSTPNITLQSPDDSPDPTITSVPAPGYPEPFVSNRININSGYFLDTAGYEDVAVLALRAFGGPESEQMSFQALNTYFIETAAKLGKKKLIIDLSYNNGGTILQGFDVFKLLFPSILPYGGSRARAHESLDLLGQQNSYLAGTFPRSLDLPQPLLDIAVNDWNYRTDADINYQPFNSWAQKYGPIHLGPGSDDYTSILRWNLSDTVITEASGGIYVSGYGPRSNITTQPFLPENIIILTDGTCSSTCATLVNLLTTQASIKTVTVGGRPGHHAMQPVGGTKHQEIYDGNFIYDAIAELYQNSAASLQRSWQSTLLANYTAFALYRSAAAFFNVRMSYKQGEENGAPLHFRVDEADCRVLYTKDMVLDQSEVWRVAADSIWSGGAGKKCIAGKGSGGYKAKRDSWSQAEPEPGTCRLVSSTKDKGKDGGVTGGGKVGKANLEVLDRLAVRYSGKKGRGGFGFSSWAW